MTVLDNTPRDQYTATGGQVAFSYTFEIAAEGDIAVLQNGVLLSLGAGAGEYAVTGVGSDTGGVVTLVTGATAGDIITLYRDMALERLTSYTNGGDFLAADVNNDYDRLWLALQQNTGTSNRALVAPNTDPTNINMTIPDKATRLGKYLTFNSTTGNPEVGSIAGAFTAAGMNHYNFTGDGTTVNFTLGMEPGGENNTQVYIDGVYQQKDGYNVSGAVVQFSVAPPNLSTIEVMVIEVLPVGATTAQQVSFTQAGSTYGRNVQLKLQESVSVKDFGALGDGVTDDTTAIQAAIDAVVDNQTLNLHGASYVVSGLNIGVKTNIKISGGKLILSGSNAYGFKFTGNTNGIVIEDVTITGDANVVSAQKGIFTDTAFSHLNTTITQCDVSGCMQDIDLGGHVGVFVRGCKIGNTVGTSAGQGYGLVIGSGAQGVMVSDNYFYNTTRHALYFGRTSNATATNNTFYRHKFGQGPAESQAALDVSRSNCVSVVGNTFLECEGRCIGVTTDSGNAVTDIKVADNVMTDTNGSEMQIGPSTPSGTDFLLGISITGNVFSPLPSLDSSNASCIIFQSGKVVQISNNLFNMDNSYSATRNVISFEADGGASENDDITITGNSGIVSGTATRLVRLASALCTGSSKVNVYNNNVDVGIVLDFAATPTNSAIKTDSLRVRSVTLSSGSQTLNVAGYNRFSIAGDAGGSTVTDLVNAYDDKEVELRFADGNTTITRANAKLSGGTDFVSTSFDMLSLRQILTVWFELNRSANS